MVDAHDNGSKQTDLCLLEQQAMSSNRAGGFTACRFIGIICLLLVVCGPAFGQFMVQPMRIDLPTYPNRKTATTFALENQSTSSTTSVDLRLLDMTQDSTGMWQTIEPDAEIVADPSGAQWVNVGSEDQPVHVDISRTRMRSCLEWLTLEDDTVELRPLQRKVLNLWVRVPVGVLGHYCAALVAQTRVTVDDDTGIRTPVVLQFLIPVIINVQGRAMRDEVELVDADLTFREADGVNPSATLVNLRVNNDGGTYVRVVGIVRVYGERGGHWQRITEMEYPDTGIIPGVNINLQQDVGQALPPGKYRLDAALYINNRRAGGTILKEIDFTGDGRAKEFVVNAALDLDPREVPIEVSPGATRTTVLKVANASEDPVTVDAALLLPDHMTARVWVDEQGNNIRGQDFGCVDWVTIEPTQFTLRGYGRQNIKIISRMPSLPNPLPHYYSTVRLRATYESGQVAGTTDGLIYLNTTRVEGLKGTPRVKEGALTFSESTPSRYIVTAAFSNVGDTHVLPRCRVLLTEVAAGAAGLTWRDIEMSSELHQQRGNMLPLEERRFTAVLDVASIPPGTYYLTAVMQYAGGAAAQSQIGVRITDDAGTKSMEHFSLDSVGGPTRIQL